MDIGRVLEAAKAGQWLRGGQPVTIGIVDPRRVELGLSIQHGYPLAMIGRNYVSIGLSGPQEARLIALITARPDATLAELRDALPTRAALSTLWRTIGRLGFTVKENVTRRRTAAP